MSKTFASLLVARGRGSRIVAKEREGLDAWVSEAIRSHPREPWLGDR